MKRLAQNLLLSFVAILVCAALVEAFFRVLDRGPQEASPGATGPTAEHYRFNGYHPLLGYDGLPNVRARFHGQTVTHNSLGNRGPETALAKRAGVKRIVFIGDSQTWGYGVADDETMPAQLERLLNQGGARYEALNLGVGGYGTDQAFLKYLVQGRRYSPDIVVLTVFKNDPVENARTVAWGVEKPRFYVDESGRLCLGNVPPPRAPGWPNNRLLADRQPSLRIPGTHLDLARSATARFFLRREWLPSLLARDDSGLALVREHVGCIRNREAYEGDGMEILGRLVTQLAGITARQGGRLVLLFVPRSKEVEDPAMPAYYDTAAAAFRAQGIPLVDLRRRLAAPAGTAPFLPNDPHLSAAGSGIAAAALRDCLLKTQGACD